MNAQSPIRQFRPRIATPVVPDATIFTDLDRERLAGTIGSHTDVFLGPGPYASFQGATQALTSHDRLTPPIRNREATIVTNGDRLLCNLLMKFPFIEKGLKKMQNLASEHITIPAFLAAGPQPASERPPVKPRKRLPWGKIAFVLLGLFVAINAGVAFAEPLSGTERFVKCGVASGIFKDPRCNAPAPQPARAASAPEQPKAPPAPQPNMDAAREQARQAREEALAERERQQRVPTMVMPTDPAPSAQPTRVAQAQPSAPVDAAPAPTPAKLPERVPQATASTVTEAPAPAAAPVSPESEFGRSERPTNNRLLLNRPLPGQPGAEALPPRAAPRAPAPRHMHREATPPRVAQHYGRPAPRPVAAPGARIGTKAISGGAGQPNCYVPSLKRDTSKILKVEAGGGVSCHNLRYDTQIETHQKTVQELLLSQNRSGRQNVTVIRSRKYK